MNHPSFQHRCPFVRLAALLLLGAIVFSWNASVKAQTPIISLSGNLNFGDVAIGTSAQRTLTISNLGDSILTVTNIFVFGPPQPVSLLGGFSADWSGVIYPGYSQEVTVTFAPGGSTVLNNAKPVDYSGFLNVVSDATAGSNSIPVSGAGVQPQFATRIISITNIMNFGRSENYNLNFGPTEIWSGKGFPLTIANLGNADLTISNIILPGGFRVWWPGFENGSTNLTIPASGFTNIIISFAPTNVMPYGGTATIVSDATRGKGQFTVSGTAIYPTGHYIGLFTPAVENLAFNNSGYFSATVGENGGLSGFLLLGGGRQPFSGRLSRSGKFSGLVPETGGGSVGVSIQLTSGDCSGLISNGIWWSGLTAFRAPQGRGLITRIVNEPPPGTYKFEIAGSTDPLLAPTNNGVGTIRLSKFGNVHLSGTLGDGTPFSQDTVLLGDQLPLYASLYQNQGAVLGWVSCQEVPTNFILQRIPPITNNLPSTNFPPRTNILVVTNYPPFTNSVLTNVPPVTNFVVVTWVPPAVPPMLPPGPAIPGLLDVPRGRPFPGFPPNFPGTNQISGSLNWFKPAQIDPSYPDGFSFQTTVNGPTD
jgi:hypothetical protein